jgi:hypothetical protein
MHNTYAIPTYCIQPSGCIPMVFISKIDYDGHDKSQESTLCVFFLAFCSIPTRKMPFLGQNGLLFVDLGAFS